MKLENGYEMKTTFLIDFMIAEAFGTAAIKDTFNRAFEEWKTNTVYVTELCIVVNILCWQHYDKGNEEWSKMYADYYYKVREYCLDNLKGDDFKYFFDMTD